MTDPIFQYGADPEDDLRTPLPDNFDALVPATYLLASLGDSVEEFKALLRHKEWNVRKLAAEWRAGFGPLHHDHGQAPQQSLDPDTLAFLSETLRDGRGPVRAIGLERTIRTPDERLAKYVLPNLSGRSMELLQPAAHAFRMCCTRTEEILAGIQPLMEIVIPPLPLPENPTEEDLKKNRQRAKDEYDIRRYAAHALMYPHGSHSIQAYLLAYFIDPERHLKRELNIALQYCPDPQAVQQALINIIEQQPDPLKTNALFALSHFKNPDHKELFLSHLPSDSPGTVEGALRGLEPHVTPADLPALQRCRDCWR